MNVYPILYICDIFDINTTLDEKEIVRSIDNKLEVLSIPDFKGYINYIWNERFPAAKMTQTYSKLMYLKNKGLLNAKTAYPENLGFKLNVKLTGKGKRIVEDFFEFYMFNKDELMPKNKDKTFMKL